MNTSQLSCEQWLSLSVLAISIVVCGEENQLFAEHWRDCEGQGYQEVESHDDEGKDPLKGEHVDRKLVHGERFVSRVGKHLM